MRDCEPVEPNGLHQHIRIFYTVSYGNTSSDRKRSVSKPLRKLNRDWIRDAGDDDCSWISHCFHESDASGKSKRSGESEWTDSKRRGKLNRDAEFD